MTSLDHGWAALSMAYEVTEKQLQAALKREHRLNGLLDSMTSGSMQKVDVEKQPCSLDDFHRKVEAYAQQRRENRVQATHAANETGMNEGNIWTLVKWLAPVASQVLGAVLLEALQLFKSKSAQSDIDELAIAEAFGDLPNPSLLEDFLRKGNLVPTLAKAIHEKAVDLRTAAAPTGHELSSKFASQSGTFEMSYGSQSAFTMGLERLVGPADVCVEEAMRREHCHAEDSFLPWTTSNYGITTASIVEWHFVVAPEAGIKPVLDAAVERQASLDIHSFPVETKNAHHPRQAIPLAHFSKHLNGINQYLDARGEKKVTQEELIGARLYTGPMFEKYNSVNRGGALDLEQPAFMVSIWQRLCLSNRYSTSVHVINSALIKLSKRSKVLTLYRGISGGILPKAFWQKDEMGARGGTEFGFMSTTTDRAVALQYAAQAGAGTVLELQAGAIDRGADLSWLSQYPHEAEICFPPLTHLEVMDTRVDGSVLVVEVRPNVNFGALTIEEVTSKRKKLVMDMSRHLQVEVREVFLCPHRKVFSAENELADFGELIFKKAIEKLHEACDGEAKHFNCNDFLLQRMTEALQVKRDIENCAHFGRSITANEHWSTLDLEVLQRVPQVVEAINTLAVESSERQMMRRLTRDGSRIELVRSTLRHIPCLAPTGAACRTYLSMKKLADIWLDVGPLSERLQSKDDSLRSSALRLLKQKVTPLKADLKGILFRMTESILKPNLLGKATLPVRRAAMELFGAFGPVARGYGAIMKRYIGFHEVKSVHEVLTETEKQIVSEDGVTDDPEKAWQFFGPIDKKERMGICVLTLGAAGLDALASMRAVDCFAEVTDCLDWTLRIRRNANLNEATEGLVDALATMRASTLNALGKLVCALDAELPEQKQISQDRPLKQPTLQVSESNLGKPDIDEVALGGVDLLHEDPAYFVGELASFLQDPLPKVRQAAVHALGVLALPPAEEAAAAAAAAAAATTTTQEAGTTTNSRRLSATRTSTLDLPFSGENAATTSHNISYTGSNSKGNTSGRPLAESKDKGNDKVVDDEEKQEEGEEDGSRAVPHEVLKTLRLRWAGEVKKHIPAIVEVAVKDSNEATRKTACEALGNLSLVDVPIAIEECERHFDGVKVHIKRAAEALAALDADSVRKAPALSAIAGAVARLIFSLRVRKQLQQLDNHASSAAAASNIVPTDADSKASDDDRDSDSDTDDDGDSECNEHKTVVHSDKHTRGESQSTSTSTSASVSPAAPPPTATAGTAAASCSGICRRQSKRKTHFEAAGEILKIFEGVTDEERHRGLLVLFCFVEAPSEGSHGARVAAACALRDLGEKVKHHAVEMAQVTLVDRDLEVTTFLREALSNFSENVRLEVVASLISNRTSPEGFASRELANTLLALGGDLATKVSPLAGAAAAAAECVVLGMSSVPTIAGDQYGEGPQPVLAPKKSYDEAQARLASYTAKDAKVIQLVLSNYLQDHRSGCYKFKVIAIRSLLRLVDPEAHSWCADQIAVSISDCASLVRLEAIRGMETLGGAASSHARSVAFVARTDREATVRAAAVQALKAIEVAAATGLKK